MTLRPKLAHIGLMLMLLLLLLLRFLVHMRVQLCVYGGVRLLTDGIQIADMRHAAGDASRRLSAAGRSSPKVVSNEVSSFVSMDQKLSLGSPATAGIGPAGAANLAFRLPALEKSPPVKVNAREPGLPGSIEEPETKVCVRVLGCCWRLVESAPR